MNRLNRRGAAILSLGLLGTSWSCASTSELADQTGHQAAETELRAAIAAAWNDHIAAAKRKDASAVTTIYADDVVFAVSSDQVVRGRPAIDAFEAAGLDSTDVI